MMQSSHRILPTRNYVDAAFTHRKVSVFVKGGPTTIAIMHYSNIYNSHFGN